MAEGRVKWFNDNKGYGFTETDSGRDVLAPSTERELNSGCGSLSEGERVGFVEKRGIKGLQTVKTRNKILVVDDEEHVRLLYLEELKETGYEVSTAESGYKLIETIEEEKPDLVILDIKMVEYNGLDILQDIRNQFYDLPVILSTAYDSFKQDVKSISADFYVVKSFDLTELKEKIAMALETRLAV